METLHALNRSSTFELTEVHLTADNIIEQLEKAVSSECKENSRYSFVDDVLSVDFTNLPTYQIFSNLVLNLSQSAI